MELELVCEKCGRDLIGIPVKNGDGIKIEILNCESCLEKARAKVRLEKSKEMVAFCEKLQGKEKPII